LATLQQVFETTREQLQQGLGNADANDLLVACSEVHWSSDNHKVSSSDCLREGWELARKHLPHAQLFEVQLVAAHYEHATEHFAVVGLDEADAVLRFQEKLAAVLAEEGLEL
jgi:hypothetical protein